MTTYRPAAEADDQRPTKPLQLKAVLPPTHEEVADTLGGFYPVSFELSRPLTHQEEALLEEVLPNAWYSGGELTLRNTNLPQVVANLDSTKLSLRQLEAAGAALRVRQEHELRSRQENAQLINRMLV